VKLDNTELKKKNSIDHIGTIFYYEDKILRAIKKESVSHVKMLLSCGLIDELVEKNYFPRTSITTYEIEGYSLVLEHEKLENWNHSYEWSFDMLKDVALLVIEINEISNRYGYQLYDCHASNVIFNYNKPIYIDLGSFLKTEDSTVWLGRDIFIASYYMPLKLYSLGYAKTARNIALSVNYYSEQEFMMINNVVFRFLGANFLTKIAKFRSNINAIFRNNESDVREKLNQKHAIYAFLAILIKRYFKFLAFSNRKAKKLINDLQIYKTASAWGDYQEEINLKKEKRFNKIVDIVNNFDDATSVIEFAANQGKLSSHLLENSKIKKVIATDYDANAVNAMYIKNRESQNFLPLLIDFVKPEGRAFDRNLESRLSADVSIALAVTHHLILTQGYDLDYILRTISKFTDKYIIIEFMPLGLFGGDLETTPETPGYYTAEWFKETFMQHFALISDEEVDYNRHLFVGKIRGSDT